MNRVTKHVLIGSGIALAGGTLAGALSFAITKTLVNFAVDREMPKRMQSMQMAKNRMIGLSEQTVMAELAEAAKKLADAEQEIVAIEAQDGERLVGHWIPCENAERTILAMHGWRSSWNHDFGLIADFWHTNHCNVLYAEQRGQNNSGGAYMTFGLKERYDCYEWIQWVNERTGAGLPIYLAGISMGATSVLMASGLDLPQTVHGIIADCGFTSPHAIWKKVVEKNFRLPYGTARSSAADNLCRKKIQLGTKSYSTLDAMKTNTVPVLFIHGTEDDFVPIQMTYENYQACTAPKRLLVVPGAKHGFSYYMDQAGYEQAVKALWQEFD